MQRSILGIALLTALVLAPAGAHASTPNEGIAPDLGEIEASSITASLRCTVVDVRPDNRIVLRDIESGAQKEITIAPTIKLRTRAKKDFGGRRKLTFADLNVGQTVKVTVQRHDGVITRIDVLKQTG